MTFSDYIREVAGLLVALFVGAGVAAVVVAFIWSKDLMGLPNTLLFLLCFLVPPFVVGLLTTFLKAKLT